jgi:hypothetical protein
VLPTLTSELIRCVRGRTASLEDNRWRLSNPLAPFDSC